MHAPAPSQWLVAPVQIDPSVHATLIAAFVCWQPLALKPLTQVSVAVQTLPSPQSALSVANTQPVATLQVSVVHDVLSLHAESTATWLQPVNKAHVSVVQVKASEQRLSTGACVQPVTGSQPSVVHATPSLQSAVEPPQVPPVQTSVSVQALLSSQPVPLVLFGLVQTPVAGTQVPALWH